jgi:hypothetical protein
MYIVWYGQATSISAISRFTEAFQCPSDYVQCVATFSWFLSLFLTGDIPNFVANKKLKINHV